MGCRRAWGGWGWAGSWGGLPEELTLDGEEGCGCGAQLEERLPEGAGLLGPP